MSQWVGCAVSIKCSSGTYQGEIADTSNDRIVLSKAFCDGIPCKTASVTLLASDISDLKLIERQPSPPMGQSTVTIAKPVPKRVGRSHSLSENANSNRNSTQNGTGGMSKSKPIEIPNTGAPGVQMESGSFKNSTPNRREKNKQKWNKGWKDEACFGSPLDQSFSKDFDFEKNLALFNKQAVFDEINSHKPDLVKHADQKKQTKYRHDENVIATVPTTYRQISVPKQEFCEYVTDSGLIIPSISRSLRKKLWSVADRIGLCWERRTELMGRATAEMALQLLGGSHRLNPHNSHQAPSVVFICGSNRQGAMGINTARQLASHGVSTAVCALPSDVSYIKQELSLYKLTKNKVLTNISALPTLADLIIVALCDDTDNLKMYGNIADWVNGNKAPVLAIDPPAVGTPGIVTKFSIVPVLPLPHSPDNGKIYLCNLGFPQEVFAEVGIKYKSPFGPKFVIPLHPNDA